MLAAIVGSSDDAIIGKDLDGTITSWNPGAEHMYGYAAHEVLGRNISLITPPDRLDELAAVMTQVSRGERVRNHETQRVCKDGCVLDVSVTISPICSSTGSVIGASAIGRDVTDRVSLEHDRNLLESRLRQSERLESLGQLAGGIAHDFSNLLAVILNCTASVKEELDDSRAARADLDQIHLAAEQACSLVHQLLAFVRREVLQREVVNLSGLVAEVDTLLTRIIGEHIRLITSSSADLWPVEADPGQLEQVVVNLALNARDAMPGGGVLSIETENFEVDAGYAESHRGLAPGRYVRLKVSDTGAGMAPSVLERVFEPFFTTKPRGEGTGLGLTTVSAIVAQAGGEIQLYSECGVGTTCRVLLPTTYRLPSSIAQPAPMNAVLHGTETVLVVEDADALREVTRRILASHGYRVLTSVDGVDALRQVECFEGTIDLLLTDVVMPVILGNELADRLRALRPEVRVLYMSGYAQPVLGASLGQQVAPLEKPFSDFQLLMRVRGVLDGGR